MQRFPKSSHEIGRYFALSAFRNLKTKRHFMSEDLSEFEASVQEDGYDYAVSNATGQAVGFALAHAIKNRHLFDKKNGLEEFCETLYEAFTDELPVELSPKTVTVLHGIIEGITKAIDSDADSDADEDED